MVSKIPHVPFHSDLVTGNWLLFQVTLTSVGLFMLVVAGTPAMRH